MGYDSTEKIIPVNVKNYNALAQRPQNSRLDNNKIFGIRRYHREDSF